MPQSKGNRRITFRWEEVVQAVPRMANLFKEFLLEIVSSQFEICDFLLVINTNLAPIFHRFRDIAFDRSKIAIFGYPSCV